MGAGRETPPPPRRHARRRLFFIALIILASLILAEIAARVAVHFADPDLRQTISLHKQFAAGRPLRFRPAPFMNYRPVAGFADLARGANTRHNAQGFRADSDFAPPIPGVLRIICLGGSTTYGAGVADNFDTYPALLEKLLNAGDLPPDIDRVEVLNLGVGGYTSAEVLVTLQFIGLSLEPDIVLIQSAINDVIPRFYPGLECDYDAFRRLWRPPSETPFARIWRRSTLLLALGQSLGGLEPMTLHSGAQHPMPPVDSALRNLAANPLDCYRRNIESLIHIARSAGAEPWLLTQAYQPAMVPAEADPDLVRLERDGYQAGLAEHHGALREIAAAEVVGLVDLAEIMPLDIRHFTDPVHMSPSGNRVKAGLIADALRRSWLVD